MTAATLTLCVILGQSPSAAPPPPSPQPAATQHLSPLDELTAKANGGDDWAMYLLYRVYGGDIYSDTPVDFEIPADKRPLWDLAVQAANNRGHAYSEADAAKWAQRASDAGNMLAMDEYSSLCEHGLGVPQDRAKTIKLLKESASKGSYVAAIVLARCYAEGTSGLRKDPDEAARYYAMAVPKLLKNIAAGDVRSKYWMYQLRSEGVGGLPKDQKAAVALLTEAAEGGNAAAMSTLGRLLIGGADGVQRDFETGLKWVKRGVDHGSVGAMYRLATLIRDGRVPGSTQAEALSLFGRSAEQRFAPAVHALANVYESGGLGVEPDHARASELLKVAAENEWSPAMVDLGVWAIEGHDQPRDPAAAAEWFRKAVALDDTTAMRYLARMHAAGVGGLPKNEHEAVSLLQKAVDLDDDDAMVDLAEIYSRGSAEIRPDPAKVQSLLKRAARAGNRQAQSMLENTKQ